MTQQRPRAGSSLPATHQPPRHGFPRWLTLALTLSALLLPRESRAQATFDGSGPANAALTPDPAPVQEAARLSKQVVTLYESGKYGEAIPLAERALKLREVALGPRHPDVASSIDDLAELYRAQGARARAEPLFQQALKLREALLGPGHPDVAATLNNLAFLYYEQGAYARAEPSLTRALQLQEAPVLAMPRARSPLSARRRGAAGCRGSCSPRPRCPAPWR